MSNIEEISGELRTLTAGVERARSLTTAADNQAQEVAVRAAVAGFAAVASGILRVRAAISAVQAELASIATSIDGTMNTAAAVPLEASPHETIAKLATVQQGIAIVCETCTATITHVEDAQRLVNAILHSGQPDSLLQALDSVKQVLVLMVQRSGTARQAVEAAINQARQVGSSGKRSGLAVLRRPAPPRAIAVARRARSLTWAAREPTAVTWVCRGREVLPDRPAGCRRGRVPRRRTTTMPPGGR